MGRRPLIHLGCFCPFLFLPIRRARAGGGKEKKKEGKKKDEHRRVYEREFYLFNPFGSSCKEKKGERKNNTGGGKDRDTIVNVLAEGTLMRGKRKKGKKD